MMFFWKQAVVITFATALVGCVEFPTQPGAGIEGGRSFTLSNAPQFPDSLVDRTGRSWRARIVDHYVSASGKECLRLGLTPLGWADLSMHQAHQVACRNGEVWDMARDFALGGTVDPDLVFAPVADPAPVKP